MITSAQLLIFYIGIILNDGFVNSLELPPELPVGIFLAISDGQQLHLKDPAKDFIHYIDHDDTKKVETEKLFYLETRIATETAKLSFLLERRQELEKEIRELENRRSLKQLYLSSQQQLITRLDRVLTGKNDSLGSKKEPLGNTSKNPGVKDTATQPPSERQWFIQNGEIRIISEK